MKLPFLLYATMNVLAWTKTYVCSGSICFCPIFLPLFFLPLTFLEKILCYSDKRGQFHNQNSSCYIEQMLWWYQVPEIDNFEDMEPRSEKGTVKVCMVTIIKMQMQKFKILVIFGLMCIRSFLITKLIRRIIFIKILQIVNTL